MKNMGKYLFLGIVAVALEWVFVALADAFFDGMPQTERVVIGTGFFLAFELVICTGAVISKLENGTKTKEK